MIGFLLGIWKNLEWVGYTLVEGLIFMIAFNYLAPQLEAIIQLPITNISYLTSVSLFIVVTFVGKFIQHLTPTIIKINNSHKTGG